MIQLIHFDEPIFIIYSINDYLDDIIIYMKMDEKYMKEFDITYHLSWIRLKNYDDNRNGIFDFEYIYDLTRINDVFMKIMINFDIKK